MTSPEQDRSPCPETSDGQHCGHFPGDGNCCACGMPGLPDWYEEEPPGPVIENARRRTSELFANAEDENWLGI